MSRDDAIFIWIYAGILISLAALLAGLGLGL